MTRHRMVLAVYWLALVAGLVFYTAIRSGDPWSVVPLWIGVIGGTLLGHLLAVHGFPFWVSLVIAIGLGANLLLVPLAPWLLVLAFVPAALCGWASLSDRAALAAFWFPSVLWMLSILDRTSPHATPDGAGIVLFAGLAIVFLVFLRVRETRRAEMWRTISVVPLAHEAPRAVLKERPSAHVARAGWGLLASSITFAITAWIAPRLWRTESFPGELTAVVATEAGDLPCCQIDYDIDPPRSRVKEYFDLGRGFDEPRRPSVPQCRICAEPTVGDGDAITTWEPGASEPTATTTRPVHRPPRWRSGFAGTTRPPAAAQPDVTAPTPSLPTPSAPPTAPTPPAVESAPPVIIDPPATPVRPPPPVVETPRPPPVVATPTPTPPVVEPAAPPVVEPPAASPAPSPTSAPPRAASAARPERSDRSGLELLHWIALLVAGALVFQVVTLGLRPLRRLITLRHLRRPFWDETVDQRASNSWQLALIGLRDAGWRATSSEAPRDFARRVGVDGLESCATILERVRHGIRLDAADLDEMRSLADTAYASARSRVGGFARALSWLRWPLT